MGASHASVCELMKGGEGKEGEERGTGRRGCRVGPAVGVRVPHRARGVGHACLAGCDSPSDLTCEPPSRLNRVFFLTS